MASSSRKKRASKGGKEKKGTGGNEKNRTPKGSSKNKRGTEALDERELAKQRRNEHSRKRYADDKDYREKLLAYQREYQRTHKRVRLPPAPEQ